jgi:hypothetical protein
VTKTDCFEPNFGFLGQFCFEKCRAASWKRIEMFSELSGVLRALSQDAVVVTTVVNMIKKFGSDSNLNNWISQ